MNFGLTANQIKWIALVFMTIDHALPVLRKLPFPAPLLSLAEIAGRAAAPLFLFLLAESIHHTKSKTRFLLRLYLAGVFTGLFTIAMNCAFGSTKVLCSPRNILFTFFYTALYCCLIETFVAGVSEKNTGKLLRATAGVLVCVPAEKLFYWLHTAFPYEELHITSYIGRHLVSDLIESFVPSLLFTEYSLLFVALGVAFYFLRKRAWQAAAFLALCAASFAAHWYQLYIAGSYVSFWPCQEIFFEGQFWMVAALPFMLLYTGQQGRPHKLFFYIYYPVHRYALSLLNCLLWPA